MMMMSGEAVHTLIHSQGGADGKGVCDERGLRKRREGGVCVYGIWIKRDDRCVIMPVKLFEFVNDKEFDD